MNKKKQYIRLDSISDLSEADLKTRFCLGLTYALFLNRMENYYKYYNIITKKESEILIKNVNITLLNYSLHISILSIKHKNKQIVDVTARSNSLEPNNVIFEIKVKCNNSKEIKIIDKSCSLLNPNKLVDSIMICLKELL